MLKNHIINTPLLQNAQSIIEPTPNTYAIEDRRTTLELRHQIFSIFPFVNNNFTMQDFLNSFALFSFNSLFCLMNVIIFMGLLLVYSDNYYEIPNKVLVRYGAKVPRLILKDNQIWRILTANFLHLNVFHLLSNILVQIFFGSLIEKFLGKLNFCLLFLLSGVNGFYFSTIFNIFISVGSSGAIFGVFSIYLSFFIVNYEGLQKLPFLKCALAAFIMSFLSINLLFSYIYFDYIDHSSHIGGYLFGVLFGVLIIKPLVYTNLQRKLKIISAMMLILYGFCMIVLYFFK